MTIPAKFSFSQPSSFTDKDFKLTDDRHQVMAKAHMSLRIRCPKNVTSERKKERKKKFPLILTNTSSTFTNNTCWDIWKVHQFTISTSTYCMEGKLTTDIITTSSQPKRSCTYFQISNSVWGKQDFFFFFFFF